eukprot:Nitzschia sp. Nitz4//scaffold171_size48012//4055//5506//NITZ4_007117-RA/size48012-processed-gene-0.32-mRNA-1//1//CDS//3329538677//4531//frame0
MPSVKGTASVADARARSKALKSTKFPSNFSKKVNVSKVNQPVLTQWIEQKVTEVLGFEDEIVGSTAVNLFLPSDGSVPDPRRAQLDLVGFLGEQESAKFSKEVWDMLVEAEASPSGIPQTLLEKKKQELAAQQKDVQGGDRRMRRDDRGRPHEMGGNRRPVDARPIHPPAGAVPPPVPVPVSPQHPSGLPMDREPSQRQGGYHRGDRASYPQEVEGRPPERGSRDGRDYYRSGGRPPYPPPNRYPGDNYGPPPGRGGGYRDSEPPRDWGGRPGDRREDEFRRTNDWRREGSPRRDRGRYDEYEELERRLASLRKRYVKRGHDHELDDQMDDIKDRLYELDRRMRRRRRNEDDVDYRSRRGRRESPPRRRSRSRSVDSRDGKPSPNVNGPGGAQTGDGPSRRRDNRSPDSVDGGRRRRRSPSSEYSRRSRSSSTVSSRGDRSRGSRRPRNEPSRRGRSPDPEHRSSSRRERRRSSSSRSSGSRY